jgi:hypothetical protein
VAKYQRWAACFDPHGDKAHAPSVRAFREFCGYFKPTIKVHGGDNGDYRWLRRSCSDEEKYESVTADFEAGIEFLSWYKPTHFLRGNHDERLHDALDSTNGALRELAGQWIDRIAVMLSGAKVYPYCKRQGVCKIGDHSFVHGYSHGIGATRKHALTYGNVIHGHVHRNDVATVEGTEPRRGYSVGCLCELDLGYNRATIGTLAQQHGFAYGLLTSRGKLVVWQAQEVDGTWHLPSEMRTIKT